MLPRHKLLMLMHTYTARDADGYVAVWSLDTFRPLAFWKAHAGSVLTVASWADDARLLT